jgi:diguanylate cyclase (GGDEF)-like protein
MTRHASSPNSAGSGPTTRSAATSSNGLDEALTRFQSQIDAVAVGVSVGDGSLSKNISRSAAAARLLAEVWEHGAAGLMDQARGSAGAIGTNKLRGVADGPVCGKLIATALRDSSGNMTGLVVALRTVEQDKFTQRESQQIVDLASEVVALLRQKAPEPPAGLMSWGLFEERATAQERTSTSSGCVLYGNVDQLHVLNKLAGFASGDRAIAAVGEVLQSEKHLPAGAGACHLSGDRFTVYLPATDLPLGRKIAEALSRAVSERCARLDGLRTKLSISFGVAAIPESESGVTQALAAAEAACRAAKDRGRGRVEVYQDNDQSIVRRNDEVAIAGRLRKALETEKFAIVAQPLHRLQDDGEPDCYELLVRFVDDTGVLLAAGAFMSAAKRYQLLVELDRAVITKVFESLRAARALRESHGVRYSLNLSGPTIGDPAFLEWLLSNIGPHGVPGDWLQFEITESAAVANVSQTQTLIGKLQARGVEFALDDFGTGASSFSYLKAFEVSMLKLDGSFTRDLLTDTRSESLVRGIAQLGRGMNIQTAAECVETRAVRDRLKELGIDRAQGFFYGQPVPFEQVIAERNRASSSMLSPAAAEEILTKSVTLRSSEAVVIRAQKFAQPADGEQSALALNASAPSVEPDAAREPMESALPAAGVRASTENVPPADFVRTPIETTPAAALAHVRNDAALPSASAVRAPIEITPFAALAHARNDVALPASAVHAPIETTSFAALAHARNDVALPASAVHAPIETTPSAALAHVRNDAALPSPSAVRTPIETAPPAAHPHTRNHAVPSASAARAQIETASPASVAGAPIDAIEPRIDAAPLAAETITPPVDAAEVPVAAPTSTLATPAVPAPATARVSASAVPTAPFDAHRDLLLDPAPVREAAPPTPRGHPSAQPQVDVQSQSDSANELAQLAKSAEALAVYSEELMAATGQIERLSRQLAQSQEAAGTAHNDATVEQPLIPHNDAQIEHPADAILSQAGSTVEQPIVSASQNDPTVEQPRPTIIATG